MSHSPSTQVVDDSEKQPWPIVKPPPSHDDPAAGAAQGSVHSKWPGWCEPASVESQTQEMSALDNSEDADGVRQVAPAMHAAPGAHPATGEGLPPSAHSVTQSRVPEAPQSQLVAQPPVIDATHACSGEHSAPATHPTGISGQL
jgi:hypothetical protein